MQTARLPLTIALVVLSWPSAGCKGPEVNVEGMEAGSFVLKGGAGPAVFENDTEDAPEFEGSVDDSDVSFSVGAGYVLHPNVMVELDYVDFGELGWNGTWLGTPSSGTIESSGFSATVVGLYPVTDGFAPFAQLGVLAWDADEKELFGGSPLSTSDDGIDLHYGIGGQFSLLDRWNLRIGWNRWQVWDQDIDTFLATVMVTL